MDHRTTRLFAIAASLSLLGACATAGRDTAIGAGERNSSGAESG
jgi:hypothetical protein